MKLPQPAHDSLRRRKHARTKVALMQAFVGRLRSTRFEDVPIRDVCRDVEVSEATFFNYFPRKIDVMYYYSQLATIRIVWQARQSAEKSALALINKTFSAAARMMDNPYLLYEMISVLVGEKKVIQPMAISALEKKFAFPGCEGIEQADAHPMLREFFADQLARAIAQGELPKKIKIDEAVIALVAILVGVPLAVTADGFAKLGQAYQSQVQLLWNALGN